MGEVHQQHPDIDAFQHIILDALFTLGRTESDFAWVAAPCFLRLGEAVMDMCYDYLQPKRKPRDVGELETELSMRGYLTFSPGDLFKALTEDLRFVTEMARNAR